METYKNRNKMNGESTVKLESENGIYLVYRLHHTVNGYTNLYSIDAKICGVNDCNENALYISAIGCNALTNNQETLMDEFAIELLENYLQN
jgi:hypothetical protein